MSSSRSSNFRRVLSQEILDLDSLQRELECPVCSEVLQAPIVFCNRGHSLCGTCAQQLERCPLCRASISTVRNLIAESTIVRLPLPCEYAFLGCEQIVNLETKSNHEGKCNYRPAKCPVLKCSEFVRCSEMARHLDECSRGKFRAKELVPYDNSKYSVVTTSYECKAIRYKQLVIPYKVLEWDSFFVLQMASIEGLWFAWVAREADTAPTHFRIEIEDGLSQVRSAYVGPTLSLHDRLEELQRTGTCLTIVDGLVKKMVADSGFWKLKLHVWLSCDSKTETKSLESMPKTSQHLNSTEIKGAS